MTFPIFVTADPWNKLFLFCVNKLLQFSGWNWPLKLNRFISVLFYEAFAKNLICVCLTGGRGLRVVGDTVWLGWAVCRRRGGVGQVAPLSRVPLGTATCVCFTGLTVCVVVTM